MSKFADRIRKASRLTPQPLGFVTSRNANEATMVLVGIARDPALGAALAKRGADVVIVGASDAPAATGATPDAGEAVAGAWITGAADDEAKAFRESGFDFVIFDPDHAAATALIDENIGYVMRLPGDLSDVETRALEGFQLDALYIGAIEGAFTVRRQIDLQRLSAMTRKPLMASVMPEISAPQLQALRDTNVAIVAVDTADGVEKLRKTIDSLPPRTRRKENSDRPLPFVPRSAAVGNGDEEEEEHDHD